uniref:Uncharacterized protein n=1 Tax=Lotus japonicus TaxID=34305 RepID=I3S2Q8_LOTJA|nr:unknown [Lotus japonicus]
MMMMKALVPINQALNVSEFLNMARDGDGSFLIESILFLCLLQKLHEQRMVQVHHRNHKPLFLFALSHLDRHTPFRNASEFLLLLPIAAVRMKALGTLFTATHFFKTREIESLCVFVYAAGGKSQWKVSECLRVIE